MRGAEGLAGLFGIVAQEVDRLTHFTDGISGRFAGLAHDDAHQHLDAGLHDIGRPLQAGGTLGRRHCGPLRRVLRSHADDARCLLDLHFGHRADDIPVIGRIENIACHPIGRAVGKKGKRMPRAAAVEVSASAKSERVASFERSRPSELARALP